MSDSAMAGEREGIGLPISSILPLHAYIYIRMCARALTNTADGLDDDGEIRKTDTINNVREKFDLRAAVYARYTNRLND